MGDGTRHQQTAQRTQNQCNKHGDPQQRSHLGRKGKQCLFAHRTQQKPLLVREWRVAVVEVYGPLHHIVFGAAQCHAVLAVFLRKVQHGGRGFQRKYILAAGHGFAHRDTRRLDIVLGRDEEVAAVVIIAQFGVGQFFLQIAGQDLHAHHTVDRAVRQDQRLGVGHGRAVILHHFAVILHHFVDAGRPAAIVVIVQTCFVFIGFLKRCFEKAVAFQSLIAQHRLPALVRGDAELFDHRCAAALDKQIGVVLRRAGIGVQIPQVDAGQAAAHLAVVQIQRIEHHKDSGDGFGAHGTHQLRRDGHQKRIALGSAGVQSVQRHGAIHQHLLQGAVDMLRQIIQVLRPLHQVFQIADAVVHLHGQDILGVLVQPAGHIGHSDTQRKQDDLDDHHDHHIGKDGQEDGPALSFPFFCSACACIPAFVHGHLPFHLMLQQSGCAQPSYCFSWLQIS